MLSATTRNIGQLERWSPGWSRARKHARF